jgi:hypothetical protein
MYLHKGCAKAGHHQTGQSGLTLIDGKVGASAIAWTLHIFCAAAAAADVPAPYVCIRDSMSTLQRERTIATLALKGVPGEQYNSPMTAGLRPKAACMSPRGLIPAGASLKGATRTRRPAV